ncbi:hypothetical protein RBU49_04355 [Clostridium sp. MB40-C1]|uniref:hypothetical protein n=1 Tax=Clostridium sp. MB40-C1 TaxID=3070996 RepID=UPI0027E00BA6|nr:hypothetical protein [Clostridium sp. MB40-C1]WMJ81492.1 hypothetical protein RBU49_04355 [Clostridium sp. MB40-C1]
MICIDDKKTTKGNFQTNGLRVLDEVISCFITEELNVNTGLDAEAYDGEYGRIAKKIEILREKSKEFRKQNLIYL